MNPAVEIVPYTPMMTEGTVAHGHMGGAPYGTGEGMVAIGGKFTPWSFDFGEQRRKTCLCRSSIACFGDAGPSALPLRVGSGQ